MKKARIIILSLGIAFVLFVVVGFFLPSHWKVTRSVVIEAPPAAIYPYIANFKTGWPQWSAFDTEDPNITYSYAGPDEGTGASRAWVSKKMGDGFQTILTADPTSGVEFDLEMKGNQFHVTGTITFERSGTGTQVTWTDSGDVGKNPFHRYLGALMDTFMGKTFEKSLQALKQKVEAANVTH